MPHQVKGRAEMLAKFNALRKKTRKPGFDGSAIILGTKGGLTRKKVGQIADRLKQKRDLNLKEKNAILNSYDNVMLRKGSNVNSTDLATKLSLRYLMKPLEIMKINKQQKKSFEVILLHRQQVIKGTTIELYPKLQILILKLANSFGEQGHTKALPLAEKLTQRGKTLRNMSFKSKEEGDTFVNVSPKAGIAEALLRHIKGVSQEVPSLINERKKELEALKTMDIPGKERYVKLIEAQIEEARANYILFRQNTM